MEEIRLLKGTEKYQKKYFSKFEKGDTIWGDGAEPQELKRWSIEAKDEAEKELAKYRCEYRKMREDYSVVEYALEIGGLDYEFAKMDFSSFQKEALGNGVQNDSSSLWVEIDGEQVTVDIDEVLDHPETEPFEASCFLEENLGADGWDALYDVYCGK